MYALSFPDVANSSFPTIADSRNSGGVEVLDQSSAHLGEGALTFAYFCIITSLLPSRDGREAVIS